MTKRAAVDFDGTIVFHDEMGVAHAIPGAREALLRLKKQGFQLVIYTCRITMAMAENEVAEAKVWIAETLNSVGIPFDDIYTGPNKIIADVYIDDRAVGFRGDWRRVLEEVSFLCGNDK